MKKVFRRTSVLLAAAFLSTAAIQAQKSPQDMDRFIDALMKNCLLYTSDAADE